MSTVHANVVPRFHVSHAGTALPEAQIGLAVQDALSDSGLTWQHVLEHPKVEAALQGMMRGESLDEESIKSLHQFCKWHGALPLIALVSTLFPQCPPDVTFDEDGWRNRLEQQGIQYSIVCRRESEVDATIACIQQGYANGLELCCDEIGEGAMALGAAIAQSALSRIEISLPLHGSCSAILDGIAAMEPGKLKTLAFVDFWSGNRRGGTLATDLIRLFGSCAVPHVLVSGARIVLKALGNTPNSAVQMLTVYFDGGFLPDSRFLLMQQPQMTMVIRCTGAFILEKKHQEILDAIKRREIVVADLKYVPDKGTESVTDLEGFNHAVAVALQAARAGAILDAANVQRVKTAFAELDITLDAIENPSVRSGLEWVVLHGKPPNGTTGICMYVLCRLHVDKSLPLLRLAHELLPKHRPEAHAADRAWRDLLAREGIKYAIVCDAPSDVRAAIACIEGKHADELILNCAVTDWAEELGAAIAKSALRMIQISLFSSGSYAAVFDGIRRCMQLGQCLTLHFRDGENACADDTHKPDLIKLFEAGVVDTLAVEDVELPLRALKETPDCSVRVMYVNFKDRMPDCSLLFMRQPDMTIVVRVDEVEQLISPEYQGILNGLEDGDIILRNLQFHASARKLAPTVLEHANEDTAVVLLTRAIGVGFGSGALQEFSRSVLQTPDPFSRFLVDHPRALSQADVVRLTRVSKAIWASGHAGKREAVDEWIRIQRDHGVEPLKILRALRRVLAHVPEDIVKDLNPDDAGELHPLLGVIHPRPADSGSEDSDPEDSSAVDSEPEETQDTVVESTADSD